MAAGDVTISSDALSRLELQDATIVSARAFHTDPFFVYLSPGARLRARGLGLFLGAIIRHPGPKAEILTARTGGRIVGVATWIAPGGYPYPAIDQAWQLLGALRALWPRPTSAADGIRYLTAIEKVHPKEPHCYLQLLVCDPEHQRRGVGGQLLAGGLARCDEAQLPAYLETQKEANLAYYERFGFAVDAELRPVKAGPPLWTMRREPGPI